MPTTLLAHPSRHHVVVALVDDTPALPADVADRIVRATRQALTRDGDAGPAIDDVIPELVAAEVADGSAAYFLAIRLVSIAADLLPKPRTRQVRDGCEGCGATVSDCSSLKHRAGMPCCDRCTRHAHHMTRDER